MKGAKLDKNLSVLAKLEKKEEKRKENIKPSQSKYPSASLFFVTLSLFHDSFVKK